MAVTVRRDWEQVSHSVADGANAAEQRGSRVAAGWQTVCTSVADGSMLAV